MKIALVAPSGVPFAVGGAEKLWWGLQHHVNQLSDHQLELIKLPSAERNFPELIASYRRFAELDLSHFDRVISTKYPAWMVEHPDHHLYLQHTLRGLYDTYPWPQRAEHAPFEPQAWPGEKGRQAIRLLRHHPRLKRLKHLLEATPERAQLPELFGIVHALLNGSGLPEAARDGLFAFPGPLTRAIVHHLDAIALAPRAIRRYAAISRNVTRRADYFPRGVPIQVIHHPSDLPVFEGRNHDYLFTVSRLDGPKRIDLLLRAFLRSEADIELRIAGTGPQEAELKALAGDDPRVRFLGFVRDSEIVAQYRDALAVPFLPYDEDYGLITVEAMGAGKAVITCADAGGVNEFVEHGVTGWSVAPSEQALARALNEAAMDRARTRQMGDNARVRVAHVNWRQTLDHLLAEAPVERPSDPQFPVVTGIGGGAHWLVLNTFPVYPPMGGGQSRMFHLYRHIASELGVRVTLLSLTGPDDEEREQTIAPGVSEHRVPLSRAQARRLHDLTQALEAPVDDIAAIHGWRDNPAFIAALKRHAAHATLGVCAHPYLVHALCEHFDGPWLYESHNVERDLKQAILADALSRGVAEAQAALADVEAAERRACQESSEVLACAEGDLRLFRERYQLPADKGRVVPNCADLAALPMIDLPTRRRWQARLGQHRPVALFLGSWHGPNLQAAEFICRRLAPAHPGTIFYLAGSLCDHPGFRHLPPNVRALGRVGDAELRVLLASVDVALNPMTSGSGSNLKMLDYTASGVPVLTTAFGNRGLDFAADAVWLAELEAFPRALGELLACDDAARQARVARARERTERHFAWGSAVRVLASVV
ncbi:glycosyltransferase family 4 protein [Modicisalibacter zincidurans]|uniref:Glycosyltransferase family 4 protein n=1 Tax=Modicisalibacter zincidurans TaxID=1178777 RepID=A0ABP9R976_9GAMM|nr:glycosyltransferase family 4 protein [Halomonas zincidurans]